MSRLPFDVAHASRVSFPVVPSFIFSEGEYRRPDDQERSVESGRDVHLHGSDGGRQRIGGSQTGRSR